MLRARLFGPLAVEVDGRAVPDVTGLKPRSVLAWLLLHPGRHARAHVAATFWPDVLDTSARASLRSALWTIRAALEAVGGSAYLEADREGVGIAAGLPRMVDAEEFDELAPLDDPAAWEEACCLADGPLLADLADDWVLEARDDYRERFAEVALRLADAKEQRGDAREAVVWTRRALARVPVRESAHRALMRRLAAGGERAEAIAAFDRCRALLAAEFGTVPSEETRSLAGRLRQEGRAEGSTGLRSASARTVGRPNGAHPDAAVPRPGLPLAGRGHELDTLGEAWAGVRRGRGGVVLVSGAAGLGKSRLVAEVAARAVHEGARHGMGTAYELAGAPPFAPWSEALRELVADVPAPPIGAAWPADLARLCRSLEWRWGRPASPAAADPEQDRASLFEAVVEALAWFALDRPLLLVLEDIHLADRASVALLAYAGRRLSRLPALLVATRRPATTRQDIALAVDALARREALAAQITLEPLPPAETMSIVDAAAPELAGDVRTRVVAAAEGNPLLAREAARAAAEGRDLSQGLCDWVRAPLARLPGSARLLVDAAAAAGRPLDPGEAAGVVGAESLGDALDAACREELLDARARRVGFVHGLVRQACYAELSPARRAWLHGRLADVLDARPGRAVAEIAGQLVLAGRRAEAGSYLVTAAEQARALGALDEAAAFLREAASAAADDAASAGELWLALAEIESGRGSRDQHDAAFAHALALLEESGERAGSAGAYVTRGRCLRTTLCFPREALLAYERALEIIDDEGLEVPELQALALAGRAWLEAAGGDVARSQELIAATEALPEVAADPVLSAELGLAKAVAMLRSRRYAEAERESEQAGRLARAARRDDLAGAALLQAAWAAAAGGALPRALRIADRILRGRQGSGLRAEAHAIRAHGLSRMGRHAEAEAAARQELALLGRLGEPAQEATAVYDLGCTALAAGACAEAAQRLSAALDTDTDQFPRALARLRLAEARLGSGDPDGADAELDRVPFEPAGAADLPATLVPHLERLQGLVAAARGEQEPALRLLASAEAAWRRLFAVAPPDDPHAANLLGFGRSPIKGVVEPGVELGRVLAEQAALFAGRGRAGEAHRAADEAASLADAVAYDGYRDALRRTATTEV